MSDFFSYSSSCCCCCCSSSSWLFFIFFCACFIVVKKNSCPSHFRSEYTGWGINCNSNNKIIDNYTLLTQWHLNLLYLTLCLIPTLIYTHIYIHTHIEQIGNQDLQVQLMQNRTSLVRSPLYSSSPLLLLSPFSHYRRWPLILPDFL